MSRWIDADALKESMRGEFIDSVEERIAIREIDEAPTIEPKRGEWYQIKDHKVMGEGYMWHCSLCDHRVYQDSSADYPAENFCPNCGADMRGAGDE